MRAPVTAVPASFAVAAGAIVLAWVAARLTGSPLARRLRRRRVSRPGWRRRAVGLVVVAALAVVVAIPVAGGGLASADYHGTDLLDFNAPQAQCSTRQGTGVPCVGNFYGAYPWGSYTLDEHIDGISAGLTGVDLSGLPALAFFAIALILWELAILGLHLAFLAFGFAFNLNLITGAREPGGGQFAHGFGLLDSLRGSVSGIFHAGVFQELLFLSFAAIGLYAIWNGMLKRRYTRTFGQVAVSLLIYALALGIIAAPASTIGWAADTTDQAANAALSLVATVAQATPVNGATSGHLQTGRGPLVTAQDALFKLAVFEPFEILDFGGLEHCAANAADGRDISVADRVVAPNGCAAYPGASQITSTPISNQKYATWFLEASNAHCVLQLEQAALLANAGKLQSQGRLLLPQGDDPACRIGSFDGQPGGANAPNLNPRLMTALTGTLPGGSSPVTAPISGMRAEIFQAIAQTASQQSAPGIQSDPLGVGLQKALRVTWPDTPAVDAQLKEAQGQRLAVAVLVLAGSVPLMIVLGGLSLGVIFAQLMILFGLMSLPVILLAGLFPGRGHQLFYDWARRMLTALIRKFLYALVLVVLLAVEFALVGSAQAIQFGWLFAYLLQVAFFWLVLLKRHALIGGLNQAITGHQPERGGWRDELAEVYMGTRLARIGIRSAGQGKRRVGRALGTFRSRGDHRPGPLPTAGEPEPPPLAEPSDGETTPGEGAEATPGGGPDRPVSDQDTGAEPARDQVKAPELVAAGVADGQTSVPAPDPTAEHAEPPSDATPDSSSADVVPVMPVPVSPASTPGRQPSPLQAESSQAALEVASSPPASADAEGANAGSGVLEDARAATRAQQAGAVHERNQALDRLAAHPPARLSGELTPQERAAAAKAARAAGRRDLAARLRDNTASADPAPQRDAQHAAPPPANSGLRPTSDADAPQRTPGVPGDLAGSAPELQRLVRDAQDAPADPPAAEPEP
jgi:hypothetical protein